MFEKEEVIGRFEESLRILQDRPSENKYRIRDLTSRLTHYRKESFHLVVCGDVDTGKSSLINALIGRSVLPVAPTSAIFRIAHGRIPKYTVFFVTADSDTQSEKSVEISEDQLSEYGTTVGSKRKDVTLISIELPLSFLESGLVVLDTPGLGSLFESHNQMTWSYILPSANCGIFVLDSERAASENELWNIQRFSENAFRVGNTGLSLAFIQTKIDQHNPEHWQSISHQNLKRIGYHLSLPKNKIQDYIFQSVPTPKS